MGRSHNYKIIINYTVRLGLMHYLLSPVLQVGEKVAIGDKFQGQCKWQCSGDTAHHLDHMAALPRGHLLHHGSFL